MWTPLYYPEEEQHQTNQGLGAACYICSQIFRTNDLLSCHMRTSHGESPWLVCIASASGQLQETFYGCNSCGSYFASMDMLEQHMRCYHVIPLKPAVHYNLCENSFSHMVLFNVHMKEAHPEDSNNRDNSSETDEYSENGKKRNVIYTCSVCGNPSTPKAASIQQLCP